MVLLELVITSYGFVLLYDMWDALSHLFTKSDFIVQSEFTKHLNYLKCKLLFSLLIHIFILRLLRYETLMMVRNPSLLSPSDFIINFLIMAFSYSGPQMSGLCWIISGSWYVSSACAIFSSVVHISRVLVCYRYKPTNLSEQPWYKQCIIRFRFTFIHFDSKVLPHLWTLKHSSVSVCCCPEGLDICSDLHVCNLTF